MNNVLCLILLSLVSACSQQPVLIERIPFNITEFSSLKRTGSATITGQAFIKTTDGTIHYAKNVLARLNPKTSYSKQWYEVHYMKGRNIADADPRYLDYIYNVDIVEDGKFTFKNIPAGDYYISAPIFWLDEIKMEDGSLLLKRQGSFICFEVQVKKGNTHITNITNKQPKSVAQSM